MATEKRTARNQWALVFVLATNMLIDALEVSAMLVAAPSVGRDLRLDTVGTQWLISAFALGFGGLLPFGGRIVDRFGRRRVYLWAMVGFAVASVVAGVAGDLELLLASRVVKGACAALTAPSGLVIISSTFPAGKQQNRAVSVYTLAGACGFSLGLVLTGLLAEASWRWALAYPAPVVAVLLLAGLALMPEDATADAPQRRRYDFFGPLRRAAAGGRLVRAAIGAATLNGSFIGLLFVATTQLQTERGWGPLRTAVAFLPAGLPLAITALYSGQLVRRVGPVPLIALGALPPVVGYALYLRHDPPTSYLSDVLPTLVCVAAGFVLSFTALNTQAITDVAPADRAVVVAAYQTAVQAGAVVVPTAVALAITAAHGHTRWAVLIITAVGLLGFVTGVTGVGRRPLPPTAESPLPSRHSARVDNSTPGAAT